MASILQEKRNTSNNLNFDGLIFVGVGGEGDSILHLFTCEITEKINLLDFFCMVKYSQIS